MNGEKSNDFFITSPLTFSFFTSFRTSVLLLYDVECCLYTTGYLKLKLKQKQMFPGVSAPLAFGFDLKPKGQDVPHGNTNAVVRGLLGGQ